MVYCMIEMVVSLTAYVFTTSATLVVSTKVDEELAYGHA